MICEKLYRKIFDPISYLSLLKKQINEGTLLNLGCGEGGPIVNLKLKNYRVGLDAFELYIRQAKEKDTHDEYILADIRYLPFKPKSFNTVLCIDVIEHLEKYEGYALLKTMEDMAKRKVIIFTPNGFLPQDEYDSNLLQVHKTGWTVNELKKLGYKCIGVSGLKYLRAHEAQLKFNEGILKYLNLLISDISEIIVLRSPKVAFQILCA